MFVIWYVKSVLLNVKWCEKLKMFGVNRWLDICIGDVNENEEVFLFFFCVLNMLIVIEKISVFGRVKFGVLCVVWEIWIIF